MWFAGTKGLTNESRRTLLRGLLAALMTGGALITGCGEDATSPCSHDLTPYSATTLIGDLYGTCFPRCAACEGAKLDASPWARQNNCLDCRFGRVAAARQVRRA